MQRKHSWFQMSQQVCTLHDYMSTTRALLLTYYWSYKLRNTLLYARDANTKLMQHAEHMSQLANIVVTLRNEAKVVHDLWQFQGMNTTVSFSFLGCR
jgi:hypothetical protein